MATVPTTMTAAVGQKIAAADYNTYTRDAVSFLIAPPRLYVYQGTTGTNVATSGTAALMLWDTEQWDTDSMHSTSTNTSRLIATTTGLYDVKVSVYFAANATGYREVQVRKNSAGSSAGGTQLAQFRAAATATGGGFVGGALEVSLTATDYLECFANQTSGGALSTTVGASFTFASMRWVATS